MAKKSTLGNLKPGGMGYGNPTESAAIDFREQAQRWKNMAAKVGATGLDLFFPHIPLTDCWKGPGQYDFAPLDEQVHNTIAAAPNAKLFLRLRLLIPEWWTKAHPDQGIIYHNGANSVKNHWEYMTYPASLASEVWKKDTEDIFRATIEHILQSDYAGRVIGCNPALMHGGEWFEEGGMYELHADYSPLMQAAFRQHLQERYPDQTIPGNPVPTPEECLSQDIGHLRHPLKRKMLIDYFAFYSSLIADHAARCCRVIKQASAGRYLAGVYYGYTMELSGSAGHQDWLQTSGHLAFRQLLNSPDVDYVSSMLEYLHRAPGKFCWSFGPMADSARVRGKFYIGEDEARTWLDQTPPHVLLYIEGLPDASTAINILKRNFATMAAHGALEQVADLGCTWMDDPDLLQCLGQLAKLGKDDSWDRAPASQIAVFVDEVSLLYQSGKNANDLSKPLLLDSLVDLFHIGAPIDIFLLSDLTDGLIPLDQYKFYIILNAHYLTSESRAYLKNGVQKNGRAILWHYAPGFLSDTGASRQNMGETTGIQIDYTEKPSPLQVTLDLQFVTAISLNPKSIIQNPKSPEYGTDVPISPAFFADDPEAETLGILTANGKGGLIRKKFSHWTSIYSAAPCVPAAILREFARDAGVHIYADSDDLIHAAQGFVSIHAGADGEKTIRLPKPSAVRDPFDPGSAQSQADTLTCTMKKGETKIWLIR